MLKLSNYKPLAACKTKKAHILHAGSADTKNSGIYLKDAIFKKGMHILQIRSTSCKALTGLEGRSNSISLGLKLIQA